MTQTEREEWRTVVGNDGYEVSNLGRVRSIPRIKSTMYDERGFLEVNLTYEAGHKRRVNVHHLVLEAFHGPSPNGVRTHRRLDGDKENNRADNLEWRNTTAAAPIGKGSENHRAKLTEHVSAIRDEFDLLGTPKKALARKYGVTPAAIRALLAGRTWKR